MAATTPVVGVAGTAIAANCTGPTAGTTAQASDVNTALASVCSDLATISAGAYTTTATVQHTAGQIFTNNVTCAATSIVQTVGRVVPRAARVAVPDGGATKRLGVVAFSGTDYVGKRFELALVSAATPRIRVLADAGPLEGETIEVIWGSAATALATGARYQIQRQDGTIICNFIVTSVGSNAITMWAEFEYVGGAWRLGASTGQWYDGAAQVGVVAGAGA